VLAAERQLSERVELLRSDALGKYVARYRESFTAFYGVLRDGFALMETLGVNMPALRAMQIYEDPLGLRMANLGAASSGGYYSGPAASPEIIAEFGNLRQTLNAAKREGRKIQERRQLQEIKNQRERDERGEGRRGTLHVLPADAEVA
jgi:hypothetical protein